MGDGEIEPLLFELILLLDVFGFENSHESFS